MPFIRIFYYDRQHWNIAMRTVQKLDEWSHINWTLNMNRSSCKVCENFRQVPGRWFYITTTLVRFYSILWQNFVSQLVLNCRVKSHWCWSTLYARSGHFHSFSKWICELTPLPIGRGKEHSFRNISMLEWKASYSAANSKRIKHSYWSDRYESWEASAASRRILLTDQSEHMTK